MPNTVSLNQTTNFGTHSIQAVGSNNATNHPVSEMIWVVTPPPPAVPENLITWNASAGTPSMITYQDMGHPVYQLQWGPPTLVPGPPIVFPHGQQIQTGVLLANIILSSPSVVGGRDWTNGAATIYQAPSPRTVLAWWVWTINLVP
jgi:hypothetical protein